MSTIQPQELREIPLFALLDDEEAAALAPQLDELSYLNGQRIFNEGDEGGTMFIVKEGQIELFMYDKNNEYVCLGFRNVGDLFGELSLLDGQVRSASAKAVKASILYRIDRHDLLILVKAHPEAALDMMAMLGKRIREADVLLQDRVVSRNPNDEVPPAATIGERLADALTSISGDIRFVYFSFVWFFGWILFNLGIVPGVVPFDPFPFGLLTMVVSLEAIFLSLFVLMSQNRQAAREKIRNDIEYDVNIKAELGVRDLQKRMEDLEGILAQHFAQVQTTIKQTDEKRHSIPQE